MSRDEIKNLLMSFNEISYERYVDLHIHSYESDGKMSPYEILDKAKRLGRQYISISDHNTLEAYLSTNILSDSMVIPAVEFDCIYKGVLIHILGYGMNIDDAGLKTILAKSKYGSKARILRLLTARNAKDVITKIRNAGGVAILAHPACYWCINMDSFVKSLIDIGLDGLEAYYPYTGLRAIIKFHKKDTVLEIANKYNLIKTGGSDSHGKDLE